jgi:Protein of unknown function (DUF664)
MTSAPEQPPERPLGRDELVGTGSEREILTAFLDLYRDIMVAKLTGVSTEAAQRRLVPSSTTLAGLIKHLASVEREWFRGILDLAEQNIGKALAEA